MLKYVNSFNKIYLKAKALNGEKVLLLYYSILHYWIIVTVVFVSFYCYSWLR